MTGARSSRFVFVGFFSLCTAAAYLFWKRSSSSESDMADNDYLPPQLTVTLSQAASSTPGVIIKVANTGKSPVTILTWESPLDPLAVQLGLLTLTPAGAEEPLDIATIKVSRQLPPDEESLVSLAPGESRENEVVFKEPVVPLDQFKGKVAVVCKGRWMSVWSAKRGDLSAETIGKLGAGDASSFPGHFLSNSIEVGAP